MNYSILLSFSLGLVAGSIALYSYYLFYNKLVSPSNEVKGVLIKMLSDYIELLVKNNVTPGEAYRGNLRKLSNKYNKLVDKAAMKIRGVYEVQ